MHTCSFVVLFYIVSSVFIIAQPLNANKDLLNFINKNELQFYWDTTYNLGMITSNNTVVSFTPGISIALVNFTSVYNIDAAVHTEDGLKVTSRFINFLRKTFSETSVKEREPSKKKDVDITATLLTNNKATFNTISVVVIDPGHGGKDPGAIGSFTYQGKSYRILEKTIVLRVALKVKKLLQKEFPQLKIVMTRDTDTFISLEKRTIIANRHLARLKADEAILFVSIHANASLKQKPSGYEVWYLPPEHRRNLVEKNVVGNKNIYSVLNSIREEELILENIQLAKNIISGMSVAIGNKSYNRGIKEELWYVVRNAKMPAVLIELGFVSNPHEGAMLSTNTYQDILSGGILQGIKKYIELFDVSQIK